MMKTTMETLMGLVLASALLLCIPAFTQEHRPPEGGHQAEHATPPRANGGKIPAPPEARKEGHGERETERDERGQTDNRPHVNNDHWYGHDSPNDSRFHVAHPFEHGRFEHPGPSFRYNVVRVDPGHHRFWIPQGVFFEVAAWDWAECSDWCWNCGDDFVIYDDPDHIGWYLLYNIQTGGYVHVIYMGS
jgi:hypothetical protein